MYAFSLVKHYLRRIRKNTCERFKHFSKTMSVLAMGKITTVKALSQFLIVNYTHIWANLAISCLIAALKSLKLRLIKIKFLLFSFYWTLNRFHIYFILFFFASYLFIDLFIYLSSVIMWKVAVLAIPTFTQAFGEKILTLCLRL